MSYAIETFDPEIYEAIENELKRETDHLEMIASENFTFPEVMEAMGSVFTNKYAEGYPYKRYYGGCEYATVLSMLHSSKPGIKSSVWISAMADT